jgi:hypothetical protein
MSCECASSPFLYKPAGHVVTGNLNIIKNRHIRKLLVKGPSYREQNNVNWNKVQSILLDAVRKYKVNWARKEHVDVRLLNEWHHKINQCILVF